MRTLPPAHHARVELASATGSTGPEYCAAALRCVADLERRGVDTRNLSFRFRRSLDGTLIAEAQPTIGALLMRMRERRLRDQKASF